MSDATRRFFAGNTLQQAVLAAASHYGLEPDEVGYRQVEKRHGFVKLPRRVVIEVDPERPRRPSDEQPTEAQVAAAQQPPSRPASREPRRPAPAADRGRPRGAGRPERRERDPGRPRRERDRERRRFGGGATVAESEPDVDLVALGADLRPLAERLPAASGGAVETAREAVGRILEVAGLRLELAVLQGEEGLVVELSGRDSALLTAEDGELLLAIDHLLPRVLRGLGEGEAEGEPAGVRVDCGNFQELREERLRSLAQRVAGEVRRTGRPQRLRPMNPADRRVVHLTIADEPGVASESEGDGFLKRVRVQPE
jgi:spoIIIJ-associated protein